MSYDFFYTLGFIFTSIIFFFPTLSSPLSIGLCLLLLTLFIALTAGLMYAKLWLSYILVLVFLGGLLVIFIYVALVASNEQFYLSWKPLLVSFLILPGFIWEVTNNFEAPGLLHSSLNKGLNRIRIEWINQFYYQNYTFTLFLVIYLLLTLLVVVFNTKNIKITLRRIK